MHAQRQLFSAFWSAKHMFYLDKHSIHRTTEKIELDVPD